jgi:hypothetical protein
MESLYWISLSYATFGIVVRGLKVIKAAPIAQWTVGKKLDYVLSYYQNKGAIIRKV